MDAGYKHEKEAFVTGMTGSSIFHVNMVSLVALSSVFLYGALRTRLPYMRKLGFLTSWILLVLPLLLSMTLFAERPLLLNMLLAVPGGLLLMIPRREGPSPLPSKQAVPQEASRQKSALPPLPALTTYRAHMMLMTVLAILAVDFPVFPRSLAKCETYGVSLMDLGVGSFVFSQGMVSAIPLLRDPGYLTAPTLPKLLKVTRKCIPIILLGVIRVIMVKGTEYPEHITEYGLHWNFFITLALLPILQVLLHPVIVHVPISLIGIAIAVGQQFALWYGLKEYVLSAPRTSIVSQNKEGLVSLTGYLAIHILGLSAGTMVLPPSPSFFRRRQSGATSDVDLSAPRDLSKMAVELCSYSIVWWTLLWLTRLLKIDDAWHGTGGVSRRIVNVPYILWVAAYNVTFVLAYTVVLDIVFFPKPKTKKSPKSPRLSSKEDELYAHPTPLEGNPPKLLEAINNHSLTIFLIANLMTGVVNLSMKTMYASNGHAMLVLGAYSASVSAIAWFWDALPHKRPKVA
ncbi:GPI-anchored wall transfer protein 1 [Coprinopsis sp. MPI-PUGE-AT-0042]|nr:GPI-anchored wall transfer protein 1 [Coprinopsis sp. MPI-PUGE-AT-0042]